MNRFKAAIFDLDGVLADSAVAHFAAWKRIADALSIPFDEEANEALKGVDRMGSLRHILDLGGVTLSNEEMIVLAERKNGYYLEAVAEMTPADLLPGAAALVERAKLEGMKTAVASASRNARSLLDRLGIVREFDFIADAGAVAASKPAPDIFLACSTALSVRPAEALGFEDAAAGVEAIIAAGMTAIGIGDPIVLARAAMIFPDTASVKLDQIIAAQS